MRGAYSIELIFPDNETVNKICSAAILAVSCGTVAFTGRKQMLLFSDSEIVSMSEQSYSEFMATAKVSANGTEPAVLTEVGKRMTSALETYLASAGKGNTQFGILLPANQSILPPFKSCKPEESLRTVVQHQFVWKSRFLQKRQGIFQISH